jgi:hypothetical protein
MAFDPCGTNSKEERPFIYFLFSIDLLSLILVYEQISQHIGQFTAVDIAGIKGK